MKVACLFLASSLLAVADGGLFGCSFWEFKCDDGGCIDFKEECDGKADCKDGSDEKECKSTTKASTTASPATTKSARFFGCGFWEYECDDGECIDSKKKCDGRADCKDGSDEVKCATTSSSTQATTRSVRQTFPTSRYTSAWNSSIAVTPVSTKVSLGELDWDAQWYKESGELPDGHYVQGGRLVIPHVTCEVAGRYICVPKESNYRDEWGMSRVEVVGCDLFRGRGFQMMTTTTATATPPPSPQVNCTLCRELCSNVTCPDGRTLPKAAICDGVSDCSDGRDEVGCYQYFSPPQRGCSAWEFMCASSARCISESRVCDGNSDCEDGSDEFLCDDRMSQPKITMLPSRAVEVDCLDPSGRSGQSVGGALQLECHFYGNPMPVVKWKRHGGHVPSKCTQSSYQGHGILNCPDFTQSDQGSYSCIGENTVRGVPQWGESLPRSLVTCKDVKCDDGFVVVDENNVKTCLDCFCSGKTDKCSGIPTDLIRFDLKFPTDAVDVSATDDGRIHVAGYDTILDGPLRYTYCSVPREELKALPPSSFLESYGRNLVVPLTEALANETWNSKIPHVVIGGNRLLLKYTFNRLRQDSTNVTIRLWRGNWHRMDGRIASRRDIMTVLSGMDLMMIRCERGRKPSSSPESIILESSKVSALSTSPSYVEKCTCPMGYDGLSCQICAPAYVRDHKSIDFKCVKSAPEPCPVGYVGDDCRQCDLAKLYYMNRDNKCVKTPCFRDGSKGMFPDINDKCICKDGVEGDRCDRCKPGRFHLTASNPEGCIKCWCSGLNVTCNSSGLYRETLSSTSSGGYQTSLGSNFWLLGREFNGKRVTSYGGYLKYMMTYEPGTVRQPKPISVEIMGTRNMTIKHVNKTHDPSQHGTRKWWKIDMVESEWVDENLNPITRDQFLQVLVNVYAVYIEAPHPILSNVVKLSEVQLSIAVDMTNTIMGYMNSEIAADVEVCSCPPGYVGLSCESCANGYYRRTTPGKGFECAPCQCDACDPELGCLECANGEYRSNPKSSGPPVCKACPCSGNERSCLLDDFDQIMCNCKEGFIGADCSTPVTAPCPSGKLTVTLTPDKVSNLMCGSHVTFNCSYSSPDDLQIVFEPKYAAESTHRSSNYKIVNNGRWSTVVVVIEDDLELITCVVRSPVREVGRLTAVITGTVSNNRPPEITNCYEEPKYVAIGNPIELVCSATGLPEPNITWHSVANNTKTHLQSVNGIFDIDRAEAEHNGTVYVCTATNAAGSTECRIKVYVTNNCSVVNITPQKLEVYEGDTAKFLCRTTTGGKVKWSRSGGILPPGAVVQNDALFIRSVSVEYSGEYVCTLDNEGTYETGELIVKRRRSRPTAHILQGDTRLEVGESLKITCVVTGYPEPAVTWSPVPGNAEVSQDGLSLVIRSVTTSNVGIYNCSARSELGADTSSLYLSVVDPGIPPSVVVHPTDVVVESGSNVSVECSVTHGKPQPSVTWRRLNSMFMLSTGPKLSMRNVQSSDTGAYVCEAVNSAGSAQSIVSVRVFDKVTARITPRGTLNAVEGSKIDVNCQATGKPDVIRWSVAKRDKKTIELETTGPDLKLVVYSDMKSVTCTARNEWSNASATLGLFVTVGTASSKSIFKRAPIGTTVELTLDEGAGQVHCKRIGSPVRSANASDACVIYNGLRFPSVQTQHNGTYVCTPESGEPVTFHLRVVGHVMRFKKELQSYMQVPIKAGQSRSNTVEVTFKANHTSGIILAKKDHTFALLMEKGQLRADLIGSDRRKVTLTSGLIRLGVWHTALVEIGPKFRLTVYDESANEIDKKADASPQTSDWTGSSVFYMGGATVPQLKRRNTAWSTDYHSRRARQTVWPRDHYYSRRQKRHHNHRDYESAFFDGCVSQLIVNNHEYRITDEAVHSRHVSVCNVCESNPCGPRGVCFDAPTHHGFVCVCEKHDDCRENCNGRKCHTGHDMCSLVAPCSGLGSRCQALRNSLRCHCGRGYSGLTCDKREMFEFSMAGESYARLPWYYLPHSIGHSDIIEMTFRLSKDNALLFFQGDRDNFIRITVQNYDVFYEYKNQGKRLVTSLPLTKEDESDVEDDVDVDDDDDDEEVDGNDIEDMEYAEKGNHHTLLITRSNNTVWMDLDDGFLKSVNSNDFSTNKVRGNIYIGGLPRNMSDVADGAAGFFGCILNFRLGDTRINFMSDDIERVNFGEECRDNFSA